jgi:hypothetical protein
MPSVCMLLVGLSSDFAKYTSAHGLPQIANARNWIIRLMWMVLWVAGVTVFGYNLYLILKNYFSWPVQTNLEVSVCNARTHHVYST